jgi:hypothetical protein
MKQLWLKGTRGADLLNTKNSLPTAIAQALAIAQAHSDCTGHSLGRFARS